MTHLELVAEIGSGPMEIVKLYLKGLLSFAELENILGRDKASLVHTFAADGGAGKIGEYGIIKGKKSEEASYEK